MTKQAEKCRLLLNTNEFTQNAQEAKNWTFNPSLFFGLVKSDP